MSELHSIKISRGLWKAIIVGFMIVGVIIFSVFSSTFFIDVDSFRWTLFIGVGGVLIGVGFGLAYARVFKIKEIDY